MVRSVSHNKFLTPANVISSFCLNHKKTLVCWRQLHTFLKYNFTYLISLNWLSYKVDTFQIRSCHGLLSWRRHLVIGRRRWLPVNCSTPLFSTCWAAAVNSRANTPARSHRWSHFIARYSPSSCSCHVMSNR